MSTRTSEVSVDDAVDVLELEVEVDELEELVDSIVGGWMTANGSRGRNTSRSLTTGTAGMVTGTEALVATDCVATAGLGCEVAA
jgi:hypothetical protein